MELAYCKIYSNEFGYEEFIITDEVASDIENFIYYQREFSKAILMAISESTDRFKCNDFEYEIVESQVYTSSFFKKENENDIAYTTDYVKKVNVYKYKCHCLTCQNKFGFNSIDYKIAVFITATNKIAKIELSYCKHCGEYYIDSKSLEEYEKELGVLLCKRVYSNEFDNELCSDGVYGAPSILTLYGYNARKNGPDRTERRKIISHLIENGIAEKHEIKEMLSHLIDRREYRFPDAADKWKEDLVYTNNYYIGQENIYGKFSFVQK